MAIFTLGSEPYVCLIDVGVVDPAREILLDDFLKKLWQHEAKVREYALAMGNKLGYSDEDLRVLELAAIYHDVGKILIPLEILTKPDRLTDEEYAIVKEHPRLGAESKYLPSLPVKIESRVKRDISEHHEKYGGGGYPNGIRGRSITLNARVLSLADTYDAITEKRPYNQPRTPQEAFGEILRCVGSQFDPELAPIFIEAISELIGCHYDIPTGVIH